MKKEYLKQIKETIKDLKSNRDMADNEAKNIEKRYNEQISEYDINNYFEEQIIETLKIRKNKAIYDTYEIYGMESSIHIIYEDGSECCVTGIEIVTGEINPKMQHIVYATYQDGYIEYDTETGELNYDVSIDEEQEERENYFNNIEIKYGTEWGIKHKTA